MSAVTSTSRDAYAQQVISGRAATQWERIWQCFLEQQVPLNRRQVSELTRITINAVTGRISPRVCDEEGCDHAGCRAFLRVAYRDVDRSTGARVEYLEPIVRQGGLF